MSDFFDTDKIVGTLGDFWYSLYTNRDQVGAVVESFLEVQEQIAQETDELEKSLNRHTVPVFRKVKWYPIRILESKFNESQYPYITFDSGIDFNSGYTYGHQVKKSYRVEIPEEIVSISSIQERIKDNMVSISSLVINNHSFYTDWNPFNTSSTYIRDVYNEVGEVVDREATIWLKDIEVDQDDLYNLFGYVVGIKMPSSDQYKNLINGLMDTLVNGPSKNVLFRIFSALLGISVINNQPVLKIYAPLDKMDDIPGIQVTSNLIPGKITGTYVENKQVPVSYSVEDGFARVDFPCVGNADKINEIIFLNGKTNCQQITDACEIAIINKILDKPNIPTPPAPETLKSEGGLSTWVRVHRFR